MKRLALALLALFALALPSAAQLPNPKFATISVACVGYLYGNGGAPASCVPAPSGGGLYSVGTSGATLGLLSTNNYISGAWTFQAPATFAAASFSGAVGFTGAVTFGGPAPGDINHVAASAGNSAGGGSAYVPSNGQAFNVYNAAWGVGALANGNGTNISTNAAFGYMAMGSAATPGTLANAGFGYWALGNANGPSAAFNTGLGNNAGRCVNTSSGNVFVGHGAGGGDDVSPVPCTGADTTAVGSWSGQELSTGGGNSFFGMNSGLNVTIGIANVYLGLGAGACTSSGTATPAGCAASYNVAAGFDAALNFSGTGLVAAGYWAAKNLITGSRDTFGGYSSGQASLADSDLTGWGYATLFSLNGGAADSAFGSQSLSVATTGSWDSAHGTLSFGQLTTGSYSEAFGVQAGWGVTTANRGIYIGYQAGLTGNFSDVVVIGSGVSATASHSIVIGDNNMTSVTIGPAAGASCAAGTVSLTTLTVTYGIVTHC